eukprot:403342023
MVIYKDQSPIKYNAFDVDSKDNIVAGGSVFMGSITDSCAENKKPFFEILKPQGQQTQNKIITSSNYCEIVSIKIRNTSTSSAAAAMLIDGSNNLMVGLYNITHASQFRVIKLTKGYSTAINPNSVYFAADDTVLMAYRNSDNYFMHALNIGLSQGWGYEQKSLPSNKAYSIDAVGSNEQYVLVYGLINNLYMTTLYERNNMTNLTAKRSYFLDQSVYNKDTYSFVDMSARQSSNSNIIVTTCLNDKTALNVRIIQYDIKTTTLDTDMTPIDLTLNNYKCVNVNSWNYTHFYVFLVSQDDTPCFGVVHLGQSIFQRKSSVYNSYPFNGVQHSYVMSVNLSYTSAVLNNPVNYTIAKGNTAINQDISQVGLQKMSWFGLTDDSPTAYGYLYSAFITHFPEQRNNRSLETVIPPIQNMTYYLGAPAKSQIIEPITLPQCTDSNFIRLSQSNGFSSLIFGTLWNYTVNTVSVAHIGTKQNTIDLQVLSGQIFQRIFYVQMTNNSINGLDSTVITQFENRFEIYTIDTSKMGTYEFTVKYIFQDTDLVQQSNYTLSVVNICATASITSFTMADIYHDVAATTNTFITVIPWTHDKINYCPSISYAIYNLSGADVTYSQSIVLLNTTTMRLQVNTTDTTQAGIHYFYLRGSISNSSGVYTFKEEPFNVTIFNQCQYANFIPRYQMFG